MPSSFCIAIGIFLSLNVSSVLCQEAAHHTRPALRAGRLRHNNYFNGRRVNTDDAWHRLAQEDLDHGDGDESIPTDDDDTDGGSDFVDLLRQTEPQYLLQQQQEVIDEMLTLAFSDISVAFNSLPPQTAVPTTIDDPPQSRNRTAAPTASPTTPTLLAEDDFVVTVQDQPVDINVLGNDFSASTTTIDDDSKNTTISNSTDPGGALSMPSGLSPTLTVGNFTEPLNGEAALNSDGTTIRYTPFTGYTNCPDQSKCSPVIPPDCFAYEACEATICVWAKVCVEVKPSFTPRPQDDVAITPQGEAIAIDVLANDISSVAERPLTLTNVTQPTNGTVQIFSPPNETYPQIIYSPSPGYNNCPNPNECSVISPLDCFEYQVCDAGDDSSSFCAWANACVEVIEAIVTSAPSPGPMTPFPTAAPTTTAPTSLPTLAPTLPCDMTPEQRAEEILFTLVDISSPALLSDPTTPQGRAFRWLVDEDAFYVCPSDNTCDVIQRFVLAVIYYSTVSAAIYYLSLRGRVVYHDVDLALPMPYLYSNILPLSFFFLVACFFLHCVMLKRMVQTGFSALGTALLRTIVVMISLSIRDSLVSLHLSQNATGQVYGAERIFVLRRLNLVRIINFYFIIILFDLEGFATLNDILLPPF